MRSNLLIFFSPNITNYSKITRIDCKFFTTEKTMPITTHFLQKFHKITESLSPKISFMVDCQCNQL